MENEYFLDEYFYIDIYYLKRIFYLYSVLIVILLFMFTLSNGKEYIPIIAVFVINLICSYVFLGYSRTGLSNDFFRVTNIHLIFTIIINIIGIVRINLDFLYVFFMFDSKGSILENIYFFVTIPMGTLMLSSKNKCKFKSIVSNYVIIMVLFGILNFMNNKNDGNDYYLYMIFYIVDFLLLLSNFIIYKNYKLRKEHSINILASIGLILCILDIISIFLLKHKREFVIINIIRFLSLNIILSHFISKTVYISNRITFKDMHNVNNNLKKINRAIAKKNIRLEKTKKRLLASNRVYRDFIKVVNIPVVMVNIGNERITFCNDEFVKITKSLDIRSCINKKINKFISIQEGEEVLQNIKSGQVVLGYFQNCTEVRLYEINFVILNERNGDLLLLFDDITEKKNIERIKIELEKIQRNEKIKNKFLSSISHDLKTPIGIIDSAVQLQKVYLEKSDYESISKYNKICKENSIYLTRLTNNLIDISRISEQLLQPVLSVDNIVPFLESKVEIISEYANINKIRVIFDTNDEEIFVKFDKEFMERVVLNLLSNSIKYTDAGGLIEVNVIGNSDEVKIEFRDTGRGMDEKFIKEAFNIYSMESYGDIKKKKSSGIGLYVVYNLIEIQHGKINIESEVGSGSKFIVTFKREQVYESIY